MHNPNSMYDPPLARKRDSPIDAPKTQQQVAATHPKKEAARGGSSGGIPRSTIRPARPAVASASGHVAMASSNPSLW